MKDIKAYSEDTNTHYSNWQALIAAEAHGYTVVLLSSRDNTVPWVVGLWPPTAEGQAEAKKARVLFRRRALKEEQPHTVKAAVRIIWKGDRK